MPWVLGPADGRYVLRDGETVTHVLVVRTLGAPERRRRAPRRPRRVEPDPPPEPVATSRVTLVDAGDPLAERDAAQSWLTRAGDGELAAALTIVERTLRRFRAAAADPDVPHLLRGRLLSARLGYGAGEEVADGRWRAARELSSPVSRTRRRTVPGAQARLAAVLGGRERVLVCEELVLRAQADLRAGEARTGALQALVALDSALAELPGAAAGLEDRLAELRALRPEVLAAAQVALSAEPDETGRAAVTRAVERLQAALRASAAATS